MPAMMKISGALERWETSENLSALSYQKTSGIGRSGKTFNSNSSMLIFFGRSALSTGGVPTTVAV